MSPARRSLQRELLHVISNQVVVRRLFCHCVSGASYAQETFSRAKSLALLASCVSMKHFSCEVHCIGEPPEIVGGELQRQRAKRALIPLSASERKHLQVEALSHGGRSAWGQFNNGGSFRLREAFVEELIQVVHQYLTSPRCCFLG